jgi:putative acetyltransferase
MEDLSSGLRTEWVTPDSPALIDAAREIFIEYADSLGIDLGFQGFDEEIRLLPRGYLPPEGALLLAMVDGDVAGCAAMRPLTDVDYANACEMKRLYVRRPFRKFGLGRALAQSVMDIAASTGYSTMLLDTLVEMEAARELYASLGFVEVPPYYYNPLPGAHYFKADLSGHAASSRY